MICYHCSTELRNIIGKVHQVFGLFSRLHIIEMNVLIAPLEVVNDPFVSKLFLHDKYVLKEVDYPLLDVEVVELSDHCLLVLQVSLVLVYECISFVNHAADVVEQRRVCASLEGCESVLQRLVFFFLLGQLFVHVPDLGVVSLELSDNHFFVFSTENSESMTYHPNLSLMSLKYLVISGSFSL